MDSLDSFKIHFEESKLSAFSWHSPVLANKINQNQNSYLCDFSCPIQRRYKNAQVKSDVYVGNLDCLELFPPFPIQINLFLERPVLRIYEVYFFLPHLDTWRKNDFVFLGSSLSRTLPCWRFWAKHQMHTPSKPTCWTCLTTLKPSSSMKRFAWS